MTISFRIVCLDYYMATPGAFDRSHSPFSTKELSKVPVIRIFGTTLAGQKACLHIHQIYPYFFVPYTIPEELKTEEEIQRNIFQFGTSLNEAMNIARPQAEKDQHIVAIVLTRGVPFYGYHVGYQYYLKIYLTNPYEKQQILDLLQSEAIQGTRFQPYEAHLNFELQFLMDYNLYGMDWLHIDEEQPLYPLLFRLPLLDDPKSSFAKEPSSLSISSDHIIYASKSNSSFNSNFVFTSKTIPAKFQSDRIPRDSYCELELDITGMSILNRLDLQERNIHVDLESEKETQREILSNPERESKKKMVKSLDSIWKDEISRRKSRGVYEPIPSVSQTGERDAHTPWIAEPSLRKLMIKMMTEKKDSINLNNTDSLHSESLLKLFSNISTIFEANEALYPEEYQTWKAQYLYQDTNVTPFSENIPSNIPTSFAKGSGSNASLPRNATPPPATEHKASSQFNVTATPSRYSVWGISTQLDKSIIYSLVNDPAFDKNEDDNIENDDIDTSSEEDNYFKQDDHIAEINKGDWNEEEVGEVIDKHPTSVIEYAEHLSESYRPRKLDFMAENERIDSLLQEQKSMAKRDLWTEMIGSDDDINEEVVENEAATIEISDVPPNPAPWPQQQRKKKRRIPQVDGQADEGDDSAQKSKRRNLAELKWDKELKALRRMRKPSSIKSKTELTAAEKKYGDPGVNQVDSHTENASIRGKSSEISSQLTGLQQHKISSRRMSSSLPVTASINNCVENFIQLQENYSSADNLSYKEEEEPVASADLNNVSCIIEHDKSEKKNERDDMKTTRTDIETDRTEMPHKEISSSFFHRSPPYNTCIDIGILSQKYGHSRENSKSSFQHLRRNIATDKFEQNGNRLDFISQLASSNHKPKNESVYRHLPPKVSDLSLPTKGVYYKEPYYSKPADLPRYPTVFAGKEFKLTTTGISSLKEFISSIQGSSEKNHALQKFTRIRTWSPVTEPPSFNEVKKWSAKYGSGKKNLKNSSTQLDKPTAENTYGFKVSATKPMAKVRRIRDYIDYFSLEIHGLYFTYRKRSSITLMVIRSKHARKIAS